MSFMLWTIVTSVAILFFVLMYQGGLVPRYQSLKWGLGPRDEPHEKTPIQGRAARTVQNHMEGMLLYIPLAFIAHSLGLSGQLILWGGWLYVIGRIGFVFCYLGGVYALRSAFWGIGLLGTLLVFAKIIMTGL